MFDADSRTAHCHWEEMLTVQSFLSLNTDKGTNLTGDHRRSPCSWSSLAGSNRCPQTLRSIHSVATASAPWTRCTMDTLQHQVHMHIAHNRLHYKQITNGCLSKAAD